MAFIPIFRILSASLRMRFGNSYDTQTIGPVRNAANSADVDLSTWNQLKIRVYPTQLPGKLANDINVLTDAIIVANVTGTADGDLLVDTKLLAADALTFGNYVYHVVGEPVAADGWQLLATGNLAVAMT